MRPVKLLAACFLVALNLSAAIVRLDHKAAQGTGNPSTVTTAAMNCTGGNFVAVWVVFYGASTSGASVSSSPSNTWHSTTNVAGASTNANGAWFYAYSASVSGSMTVTVTSGSFPTIYAACYSGVQSSSDPKDQTATNNASCTSTCQTGSITPSVANELVLAGDVNTATGATPYSINNSFTKLDEFSLSGGNAQGGASAELIQTTATTENPTWTPTATGDQAAAIISFKAAAASSDSNTPSHGGVF